MSNNLLPHTLEGIKIGEGCAVQVTFGLNEVKNFLKDQKFYEHEDFFPLEVGQAVRFTVINKRGTLNLVGSIEYIGTAADDSAMIDGWVNLNGIWFDSKEEIPVFESHYNISQNGGLFGNLLIVGESGYGKTARAEAFAKSKGMRYLRVAVALLRDELAIYGTAGYDGEKTRFTLSQFSEILQEGNAVLLFDEINRTKPKNLNALFSILDDDRKMVITPPGSDEHLILEVGKGVMFIGTANIGYKFVGTEQFDAALRNRFADTIIVQQPPMAVEVEMLIDRLGLDRDTSENIVMILREIRNKDGIEETPADVGPRKALQIGAKVISGMPLATAFKTGLLNNLPQPKNGAERGLFKDVNDIIRRNIGV